MARKRNALENFFVPELAKAIRFLRKRLASDAYKQKYPHRVRASGAVWRSKNAEYCRNAFKAWHAATKGILKKTVMDAYGGRCASCGYDNDIRALCIDHVAGDGWHHRKTAIVRGGRNTYIWLKNNNYPAGFQVLCANCNLIKAIARRESGRKRTLIEEPAS